MPHFWFTPLLPSPSPSNKAGWAFTVNYSGIKFLHEIGWLGYNSLSSAWDKDDLFKTNGDDACRNGTRALRYTRPVDRWNKSRPRFEECFVFFTISSTRRRMALSAIACQHRVFSATFTSAIFRAKMCFCTLETKIYAKKNLIWFIVWLYWILLIRMECRLFNSYRNSWR